MDTSLNRRTSRVQQILFTSAAFVVVVAGMRAAQGILIPFLLAVFIATISNPLVSFLQRKRFPRGLSIFIIFLLMIAFGFRIISLLGTSLNIFSNNFPKYQVLLKEYVEGFFSFLQERGVSISGQVIFRAV